MRGRGGARVRRKSRSEHGRGTRPARERRFQLGRPFTRPWAARGQSRGRRPARDLLPLSQPRYHGPRKERKNTGDGRRAQHGVQSLRPHEKGGAADLHDAGADGTHPRLLAPLPPHDGGEDSVRGLPTGDRVPGVALLGDVSELLHHLLLQHRPVRLVLLEAEAGAGAARDACWDGRELHVWGKRQGGVVPAVPEGRRAAGLRS
mmetsp:Transcript_65340/g.149683  ORF Transcript_65340/g.149683 Transcript_65340/m.149683 type:complete len:204 (-) Transcript_65340:583-1194(-)